MKQVIDFQDIFLILTYNDNVLTNSGILLKNDYFLFLLSIYQFITDVNHLLVNKNLLVNQIMWQKSEQLQKKYLFMLFPKLKFPLCAKI